MGHLVQMAGLAVQNFVSAAVGIAVAVALVRGFARRHDRPARATSGSTWSGSCVRILLPIAVVGAIVFVAGGMVQNLSGGTDVTTLAGATQHITGGPVASQEVIKELGTNGGGFYNANSRPPVREPDRRGRTGSRSSCCWSIPFSLPRTFGRMVGDNRQGYAIVAVMAILAIGSVVAINVAAGRARRHRPAGGRRRDRGHGDPVRRAAVGDVRGGDHADVDRRGRTRSTTPTPRSAAGCRWST